ncbi:MAG: hypothetical protein PXX73_04650 [Sideroxydans sp.]|nr:hypothetical protein [Sideroxydans sp.]
MKTISQTIQEHQAQQAVCGNCAEWTRHEDARMLTHGHCRYRPAGHYSAAVAPCRYTPSRFVKKAAP